MKSIALLTAKNLDAHVVDESYLEKALMAYDNIKTEFVVWDDDSIDWSKYDIAIIRTTWDYTQKADKFLSVLNKINESGLTLFNPYLLISWNINKIYLKDLKSRGVPIVESFYFDEDSFEELVKQTKAQKFVIKPRVGASAEGIKIVDKDELIAFKNSNLSIDQFFAQPYLEEIHEGEISYFFFNNEFEYAIKKTPKKGDFRVQEEHGGVITEHQPTKAELFEAKKAIEAVKDFKPLYLRVDAVQTKNSWLLMELEAIEPSMFFRVVKESANKFAKAIIKNFT